MKWFKRLMFWRKPKKGWKTLSDLSKDRKFWRKRRKEYKRWCKQLEKVYGNPKKHKADCNGSFEGWVDVNTRKPKDCEHVIICNTDGTIEKAEFLGYNQWDIITEGAHSVTLGFVGVSIGTDNILYWREEMPSIECIERMKSNGSVKKLELGFRLDEDKRDEELKKIDTMMGKLERLSNTHFLTRSSQ